MLHTSFAFDGGVLSLGTKAESDGFVAANPLKMIYAVTMTTKLTAAPKRLILTQCNSAISFMKQVGNNKRAIVTP